MKTKSTPSEVLGKTIQKSEEAIAVINDAITRLRKNEYKIVANEADENRDALYRVAEVSPRIILNHKQPD